MQICWLNAMASQGKTCHSRSFDRAGNLFAFHGLYFGRWIALKDIGGILNAAIVRSAGLNFHLGISRYFPAMGGTAALFEKETEPRRESF
jgi:hypothetical protein